MTGWWDIVSKRDPVVISGNQMVGHVILAKCMVWYKICLRSIRI